MAWKLAEVFVEFVTKGFDTFKKVTDDINKSLAGMKAGVDAVAGVATVGFAAATASLGGFVRAGMQGTVVSDQLSFRMGELSRNIAGLFRPELERVIETIERAVAWFRGLSEAQRENIVRWTEGIVVGLGLMMILPKIITGVSFLVGGIKTLTMAMMGFNVATGSILPIIGGLLSLMLGVGVAAKIGEGGLGGLMESVKPLMDVFATLGSVLADAVQPILPVLAELFGQIIGVVKELVPHLAIVVGIFATNFVGALRVLMPVISMIVSAVGRLMVAFAPIIELVMLVQSVFLRLATTIVAVLAQAVMILIEPFVILLSELGKLVSFVVSYVIPALERMAKAMEKVINGMARVRDVSTTLAGNDIYRQGIPGMGVPKKDKNRSEMGLSGGGFEDVAAAYNRIAQASMKMGKSTPELQLDEAQRQTRIQEQTRDGVRRILPPVNRR